MTSSSRPCPAPRLFAVALFALLAVPMPSRAEGENAEKGEAPTEHSEKADAACQEGRRLWERGESAGAFLHLQRCRKAGLGSDVASSYRQAKASLEGSGKAPLTLTFEPQAAVARLRSDRGELVFQAPLTSGDQLWLAPGTYELSVEAEGFLSETHELVVEDKSRVLVEVQLQAEHTQPSTQSIDAGQDEESELGQVERQLDPRAKSFKTLLPKRYRMAPDPRVRGDTQPDVGLGPWPYVAATSSLAFALGGTALYVKEHQKSSYVLFSGSALLAATSIYLCVRGRDQRSPPVDEEWHVATSGLGIGLQRAF